VLANAISIAVLVTAGAFMLYQKLPRNVRRWIVKYSLLTDFLAMVITYYMFGGTVTALMAGAIVDLLISAMLHIANHPQDFEWLFDSFKMIRELMDKVQVKLHEFNKAYKEKKMESIPKINEPITV
jgi:hypothetical protein